MKGCLGVVFVVFAFAVAAGALINLWDMHQWWSYPLAILGWIGLIGVVVAGIFAKRQQSKKQKEAVKSNVTT